MSEKYRLVKVMVPIYIEVREGMSAEVTLANALGAMEDNTGGVFADTMDWTSRDVTYDELPDEAADYNFEGREE